MNNEITIKQLADEIGVSKQAIRKHLDKLPPTLLVTKKGNTIFLSNEVVTYIKSKVRNNKSISKEKVTSNVGGNFKNVTGNESVVTSNSKNLFFEKQLLAKDKQLEEKDNQIKALHKLLDQQQILTLQANKKIEELELKNEEPENGEGTEGKIEKEPQEKNKSFFQRLFGKWKILFDMV